MSKVRPMLQHHRVFLCLIKKGYTRNQIVQILNYTPEEIKQSLRTLRRRGIDVCAVLVKRDITYRVKQRLEQIPGFYFPESQKRKVPKKPRKEREEKDEYFTDKAMNDPKGVSCDGWIIITDNRRMNYRIRESKAIDYAGNRLNK